MKHILAAAMLMASPVAAQDYYASIHLGSKHIGATREFNEFNPGLGLGVRWGEGFRYGVEGGFFLDSYLEWSTYVAGFAQVRVINGPVWDTYLGGAATFASYPNLVGYADNIGIPRVGNHILIPSLSLEFDHGDYSISTHVIVGGDKFDALVTASMKVMF